MKVHENFPPEMKSWLLPCTPHTVHDRQRCSWKMKCLSVSDTIVEISVGQLLYDVGELLHNANRHGCSSTLFQIMFKFTLSRHPWDYLSGDTKACISVARLNKE